MENRHGIAAIMLEELRTLDEGERRVYAHRCGDPNDFVQRLIDGGDDLTATTRLRTRLIGLQLPVIWMDAFQTKSSGFKYHDLKPDLSMVPTRWPSSIGQLDRITDGGFYGVTLITGRPKQGKSMLAQASAIEACIDGWHVIYLNAELTEIELANRAMRYTGRPLEAVSRNFTPAVLSPGVTVERIVQRVHDGLRDGDEKVLIVFDSVNSIAEFACTGAGFNEYFQMIRIIGQTAMIARRNTNAAISVLLVSEMNVAGGTKGGKLDFAADLMITMAPSKADRKSVEIEIALARSSDDGKLGAFRRDWTNGRFVPIHQPKPAIGWQDEM